MSRRDREAPPARRFHFTQLTLVGALVLMVWGFLSWSSPAGVWGMSGGVIVALLSAADLTWRGAAGPGANGFRERR